MGATRHTDIDVHRRQATRSAHLASVLDEAHWHPRVSLTRTKRAVQVFGSLQPLPSPTLLRCEEPLHAGSTHRTTGTRTVPGKWKCVAGGLWGIRGSRHAEGRQDDALQEVDEAGEIATRL